MESDSEWEVEQILQRGRFNNITYYLVKWAGYSREEATWEPITNLEHCQHAICQFESALKNVKRGSKKKTKRSKMKLDKVFDSQKLSELKNMLMVTESRDAEQHQDHLVKEEPCLDKIQRNQEKTVRKGKMTLDDSAQLPKQESSSEKIQKMETKEVKASYEILPKKEISIVDTSYMEFYVPELPQQQKEPDQQGCYIEPISRPDTPEANNTLSQCNRSFQQTTPMAPQQVQGHSDDSGGKIRSEDTNESQRETRRTTVQPSEITIKCPSQLVYLLNHPRRIQCDQLLTQTQRQMIRCILHSSPSNYFNQRPFFLDLRENPAALGQLGPIDIFQEQEVTMEVKMLGRLSFGWIGIGMVRERWTLAAVEALDEGSWSRFKERFKQ